MSKTLLLADDSVVIQKLVGLSFANEDIELVSTDNGDDAVIKAREIRPDVVLADVVMPGKSGYEVCEAIKNDPALAHVPVLLLTGTFEAFDESRATSVGADGHITKPFEAQALVERVKTVMKNAVRPAAPIAATAGTPSAERLFDDGEPLLAPAPARTPLAPPSASRAIDRSADLVREQGDDLSVIDDGFLDRRDSLDVTPSLSESDLADSLDDDLFGPPGVIGGPSFGTSGTPNRAPESIPSVEARGSAEAPIEDATLAILPEPGSAFGDGSEAADTIVEDLGFDDPLELAPLPAPALDLDSAFDPEPIPAAKIQVVRDDASAMTSRSLGQPAGVTDLDEILAGVPAPAPRTAPFPAAAPGAPAARAERRPEPPVLLDFGPAEQAPADLDFGFDVSEQAPIAKVDLLEESFSSLLDVSESQLLGDAPPAAPPAVAAPAQASPPPTRVVDFDVSSSDLATSGPLFESPEPVAAPIPTTPPPLPPRAAAPELDLDLFLDSPRVAVGHASNASNSSDASDAGAASARRAVDDLSPILQQRVHETLEKVAWEAFSDLSETIVKQVIERVERIAWDVIPQMAETLVREEIRKLKGEGD